MESKHIYFKGVIKNSKNFRNMAKTCATRHELAQLCYRFQGLFPTRKLEIPPNAVTVVEDQDCGPNVLKDAMEHFGSESLVMKEGKIFGTQYKPGSLLVLGKEDFGELDVGLVHCIVVSKGKPVFHCSTFKAFQNQHNYYVATTKIKDSRWILLKEVFDYYPLTKIRTKDSSNFFMFNLHHYVSECK